MDSWDLSTEKAADTNGALQTGLLSGECGVPIPHCSIFLLGDLPSHIHTYQEKTLSSDFSISDWTGSEATEAGAQLGGPGDLDSGPFQQKNESARFVVPYLYQLGRFPQTEQAWF